MKSPRFSLLTLLLLGTIIGLSLAVWKLGGLVKPLQEEVRRLRAEVGELHVEDPDMFHAIQVETDNRLEWKWRVLIPKGAKYKVHSSSGEIPEEGYPDDDLDTTYVREGGEFVLRFVVEEDPRDGLWKGRRIFGSGWVGADHQPWIEWGNARHISSGIGTSTDAYPKDQTVEIIRFRAENRDPEAVKRNDPAVGFMIWMEPIP